jgi:hypothetical protein
MKKAYVNLGIRPLTAVFAVWGIYRLLHRDWLNGAVLIAGWVAVSVIGYDVGKPSEMLKGDDAHLMSKGATKIMLVCFAMFSFLLVNRGFPWYYAIPSGFLVALAVAMIPLGALLIVARTLST